MTLVLPFFAFLVPRFCLNPIYLWKCINCLLETKRMFVRTFMQKYTRLYGVKVCACLFLYIQVYIYIYRFLTLTTISFNLFCLLLSSISLLAKQTNTQIWPVGWCDTCRSIFLLQFRRRTVRHWGGSSLENTKGLRTQYIHVSSERNIRDDC